MLKTESTNRTRKLVLTGVCAALLAVLSQVSIPLPTGVPITLQTFAVALCGFLLGPAWGTLSVAVYLALGAVGLPVFAGFSGSAASFVGMTGGFLWGFLPMAFLCGLGARLGPRALAIALGIGGLAACHLLGAGQFALVMSAPLPQAFLTVSVPYLVKDVVSVVLAYLGAVALAASLKRARLADLP